MIVRFDEQECESLSSYFILSLMNINDSGWSIAIREIRKFSHLCTLAVAGNMVFVKSTIINLKITSHGQRLFVHARTIRLED